MESLEGLKTQIVAAVAAVAVILQLFGVIIPDEQEVAQGIAGGIIAAMVVMRVITKGPMKNPFR